MNNEVMNSYNIIAFDSEGDYEEKKSKFICYLHYTESEEDAVSFINSIKKKHYDARHNCSAIVLGPNKELVRSSDDGEPSGTAGKPMLEVLLGAGLTNVVAVVTRYFGGVLLGTGGLVRAYTQAIKNAIDNTTVSTVEQCKNVKIVVSYSDSGAMDYYLNSNSIKIVNTDYAENITYNIRIKDMQFSKIEKDIINLTSGKAIIDIASEGYYPI